MADNNFKTTVESLFQGMDSVISTKTVVRRMAVPADLRLRCLPVRFL